MTPVPSAASASLPRSAIPSPSTSPTSSPIASAILWPVLFAPLAVVLLVLLIVVVAAILYYKRRRRFLNLKHGRSKEPSPEDSRTKIVHDIMHAKYSTFHRQYFQVFTIALWLNHPECWLAGKHRHLLSLLKAEPFKILLQWDRRYLCVLWKGH